MFVGLGFLPGLGFYGNIYNHRSLNRSLLVFGPWCDFTFTSFKANCYDLPLLGHLTWVFTLLVYSCVCQRNKKCCYYGVSKWEKAK